MFDFHDRSVLFDVVRDSWVDVLDLDEHETNEPLSGASNFFRCGGDSSLARDLCGDLRVDHGIHLTLADVFQNPTLDELVDIIFTSTPSSEKEKTNFGEDEDIPPFSLLPNWPGDHENLVQELSSICSLEFSDIEDAYPCTALQEGLVTLSQRVAGSYWASHVYQLNSEENLHRFCRAWEQVVEANPILRTSIAQTHEGSLFQLVARRHVPFEKAETGLQSLIHDTDSVANTLNSPLSRFSVVRNSGNIWFVWRIHHAAFDYASIKLILACLERIWDGQAVSASPPFKSFVAETLSHDSEDARNFWISKLQGAASCVLPSSVSRSAPVDSFATEVRRLDTNWQQRGSMFSLPTILHAAWSLVLSQHVGVEDVIYGAVLSSREAQWRAVAAPIICTIPMRVSVGKGELVRDFLSQVQSYMADSMAYAHLGLQKIRLLGADMDAACSFQSLMVTQPAPTNARDTPPTSTLPPRSYMKDSSFHNYDVTVEAYIGSSDVEVKVHHNLSKMSQQEARRLLRHFAEATSQLIQAIADESSPRLSDINLCGFEDLEEIRSFDFQCPKPEVNCIHSLVSQRAREIPQAPSIVAHDASSGFNFEQLDTAASTVAMKLISCGVRPGQMVPLLFEKSAWAVVAMLAVLKTGGVFVPLEWTQPVERLHRITAQVNATTILASSSNEALASKLEGKETPVIVSESTLHHMRNTPSLQTIELPSVESTSLAYVVFTSGSTGVPKGVMITHQAFCTSSKYHGSALGFTQSSRVLQFASYSFDVSIAEIFTTLIFGGCICIPTEDERIQDLPGALQRMEVSLAVLTPVVFENFTVQDTGSLSTVVLTGDSSSQELVDKWSNRLTLINAYGPSESSVWAYSNHFGNELSSSNIIGFPIGCVGWVVDPEDVHKLVPLGCSGELLLQGPIISDGYLNDAEKTKSSFLTHPAWQDNPEARLYRTGDLVRQNTDGSMCFLGRTDTQIKIRGQRTEVSEIENHIRQLLQDVMAVAVDAVYRVESERETLCLVAFCCFKSELGAERSRLLSQDDHTEAFLRLRAGLSNILPSYMIPQAYVPVVTMPLGVSGKLDRKQLRSSLVGITDDQWRLYMLAGEYKEVALSKEQLALRDHWARCLNISEHSINLQDSFFRLGGTSILAMRLSSMCRKSSVLLSVSEVFKYPTLEGMAKVANFENGMTHDLDIKGPMIEPFSLLKSLDSENEEAVEELAQITGLNVEDIQDAYPCTPLQEGLIAATQVESDAYILHRVHRVEESVAARFLHAWTQVVDEIAILRTLFIQTKRWGLVQVVSRSFDFENTNTTIEQHVAQKRARSVALGEPLNRFAVITDLNQGTFFVWQAHHAAFDGWSLKLIFERFLQVYYNMASIEPLVPFKAFVQHTQHLDMTTAAEFWRQRLESSMPLDFPRMAAKTYSRAENSSKTLKFELRKQWRKHCDFTLSTLLNAAWALVLATHSDTDDVIFGTTLSGRAAPVAGIETIPGPTMTTIPVRFVVNSTQSLQEYLAEAHGFLSDVVPFEQFGLSNIRRLGPDAEAACAFRTLLLLQPSEDSDLTNLKEIAPRVDLPTTNSRYQTYDIALEVFELGDDLELRMNYNVSCLEPTEASWLLSHVKTAMVTLTNIIISGSLTKTTVGDVSLFGSDDQHQLRGWNPKQSLPTKRCTHNLISEMVTIRPKKEAIRAWDGDMTYEDLDGMSSRLAHHLIHAVGLKPGEPIILCFEKSKLVIIAMVAVLKVGATIVPIEWSHPHARLEEVSNGVQARYALTIEKHETLCASLGVAVTTLSPDFIASIAGRAAETDQLPEVSPDQIAYIIFTSGSTGKPKGIPVSHLSFSTMISNFGQAYLMSDTSRVFHFSSYAFDVSLMETLVTLCHGGTVCIPPEQARKDNLAAEFVKLEANYAMFGPGVVSTLDINAMRGLGVLVLGGEAVPRKMLQDWGRVADVVIAYGSTECAAVDHALAIPRGTEPPCWAGGLLGRSIGSARSWVVTTTDIQRLAPLGCTGELLIEGPVVGKGYLNDEVKTQSHFVPAAEIPWLSDYTDRSPTHQTKYVYRTGDIVRLNVDGSLSYFGRKDLRIKIRGQRVEMGDIEACTRLTIPQLVSCAAELTQVRRPGHIGEDRMLAIFVCFPYSSPSKRIGEEDFLSDENHEDDMLLLQEALSSSLPAHMLPELYIPLRFMPMAASGKVDRKKLRNALLSVDDETLSRYQLSQERASNKEVPVTDIEVIMQDLWAECLNITDKGAISRQSHFVRLGGNSISAMRLASLAREHGLTLTVVDILKNAVLSAMAEVAVIAQPGMQQAVENVEPFSLISASTDERKSLISRISAKYAINPAEIDDIYPCTPLQEGLVALTHTRPREYIAHHVFQIQAVNVEAIRNALKIVITENTILRTSIMEDSGLVQVVTRSSAIAPELALPVSLALARMQLQEQQSILGQPLSEFTIVKEEGQEYIYLIWKAHHAAYDGWTVLAVASQLQAALAQTPLPVVGSFNRFIAHLQRIDQKASADFWTSKLDGAVSTEFPTFEGDTLTIGQATATVKKSVPMPVSSSMNYTLSTVLHAAWALTLATYKRAPDVTFGTVMSGRHTAVAGIDQVMGATVATIPLRVKLGQSDPVTSLLGQIHDYVTDATPFEQIGLQHIRRLSADAERACNFDTLLVVQPLDFALQEQDLKTVHLRKSHDGRNEMSKIPGTFTMTLECFEKREVVDLQLHFDTSTISTYRAEWVATHFTRIAEQILAAASRDDLTRIADLEIVGPADLAAMNISQEHVQNSNIQECVHTQISRMAESKPHRIAIDAWDGQLTYNDLWKLSRLLAHRLLQEGLKQAEPVLVCVDKSKLFPIAALAILAAGGTVVPVDASHPIGRLLTIAREAGVTKCLHSVNTVEIAERLGLLSIEVNSITPPNSLELFNIPEIDPRGIAYIIFTSGSTGVPKGVLVSHESLSTSSHHHGEAYHMNCFSRVLHFASYAFDVSLAETLTTLAVGGCVCIPSEEDCRNNLAAGMERFRVSVALLTPSVISSLRPIDLPHLTTLIMGGERHSTALRETWQRHCQVVNGYGPAECAISVSSTTPTIVGHSLEELTPTDIGIPHPSVAAWIADPLDSHKLVPFGCVGELLIGGPQVAQGYLDDDKKNAESFLTDLRWMHHLGDSRPERVYRTGDLVYWGANGHLMLVGRRDDQVKIRGQRLELGDVEAHVHRTFEEVQVIAIFPNSGPLKASLVVLLKDCRGVNSPAQVNHEALEIDEDFMSRGTIRKSLSSYETSAQLSMHPSLWIPLKSFPLSPSGKADRKAISGIIKRLSPEQIGSIRSLRNFAEDADDLVVQNTASEKTPSLEIVQRILSKTLRVPISSLNENAGQSFTMLGGDSIQAMVLSSQLREEGIHLTALDILQTKKLASLWSQAISTNTRKPSAEHSKQPSPETSPTQAFSEISLHSINPMFEVDSIRPCSSMQSYMFKSSQRNSIHYRAASIARVSLRDGKSVDEVALIRAWSEVVKAHSLLRSVIILTGETVHFAVLGNFTGSLDCVGKGLFSKEDAMSLLKRQAQRPFQDGCPQYRVSYCTLAHSNDLFVMFDMHHSLVDGASVSIILRGLEEAYSGQILSSGDEFLAESDTHEPSTSPSGPSSNPVACLFPRSNMIPSSQPVELEKNTVSRLLNIAKSAGFTLSTIVQAAWALTLHEIVDHQSPAFGVLLTHRRDKHSETVEPLFDIYRQQVDIETTVGSAGQMRELLATIQKQTMEILTENHVSEAASLSKQRFTEPLNWNTLVNMRSPNGRPDVEGNEDRLLKFEYLWSMDPMNVSWRPLT